MNFFSLLFNEILVRPLFNILIIFYNLSGDFGIAIILLTILIRVILYPLSAKAVRSQKELSRLQPHIQEIQKKYKNDQPTQAKELMKLYQEHGVNPFSGCLPVLIQLPILLALYKVFFGGLDPAHLSTLYYFVHVPAKITPLFLGFLDLSRKSIFLAVITALLQFWQSKVSLPPQPAPGSGQKQSNLPALMGKQALYMLPIITLFIAASLPAGPVLYWFTTTLMSLLQYLIIKPKQVNIEASPPS